MKTKHLFLFCLLACLSCNSNTSIEKLNYIHPIPFQPKEYVCYQTLSPLTIDGKNDEQAWKNANWTSDFEDIEGHLKPKPALQTRVKMLWDEEYFYFFAKMTEPHIWGKLTERDAIIYNDDDFEIFIDPDGDGHNYYEFEVNALNTLWELLLLRPYRVDHEPKVLFNWNLFDIKTAVHHQGTINNPKDEDQFWSVEWAIPWKALKELTKVAAKPNDGDQWRVNFSRVDWTMTVLENDYDYVKQETPTSSKRLSEDNWVWSPTGTINMHRPEAWGFVQFSKNEVGTVSSSFQKNPEEKIKWGLWQLYFQQQNYFKKYGHYTENLKNFTIPIVENCPFNPKIYTTPTLFEIQTSTCDEKGIWSIYQNGQIKKKEK